MNDLFGNRANMTTLEGVNSYTYDNCNPDGVEAGRLTSAPYPDGRTQEFERNPVRNRLAVVEAAVPGK